MTTHNLNYKNAKRLIKPYGKRRIPKAEIGNRANRKGDNGVGGQLVEHDIGVLENCTAGPDVRDHDTDEAVTEVKTETSNCPTTLSHKEMSIPAVVAPVLYTKGSKPRKDGTQKIPPKPSKRQPSQARRLWNDFGYDSVRDGKNVRKLNISVRVGKNNKFGGDNWSAAMSGSHEDEMIHLVRNDKIEWSERVSVIKRDIDFKFESSATVYYISDVYDDADNLYYSCKKIVHHYGYRPEAFAQLLREGLIQIDLRLGTEPCPKHRDGFKNRGTSYRIDDLADLFSGSLELTPSFVDKLSKVA